MTRTRRSRVSTSASRLPSSSPLMTLAIISSIISTSTSADSPYTTPTKTTTTTIISLYCHFVPFRSQVTAVNTSTCPIEISFASLSVLGWDCVAVAEDCLASSINHWCVCECVASHAFAFRLLVTYRAFYQTRGTHTQTSAPPWHPHLMNGQQSIARTPDARAWLPSFPSLPFHCHTHTRCRPLT